MSNELFVIQKANKVKVENIIYLNSLLLLAQ